MNKIYVVAAFVIGGVLGALGGGYMGYEVGSADKRIDTAPRAGVVQVQEVKRPPSSAAQTSATETPATETPATETPATETPATETPEVSEPPAESTPTAAGKVEKYVISPNDESELMWVGYKEVLGQKLSMEGGFANFEGNISIEDNDPAKSFVEITVDIKSIFSTNSILTGVLKSDKFFDVANHPAARFVSTAIEPADGGYLVTGNFEMRGVTQGIQFPAVIERKGDKVAAQAEFTIDRKLWNVGYDSYEEALILGEVVISFSMVADPA